jgi:hypothetical protein
MAVGNGCEAVLLDAVDLHLPGSETDKSQGCATGFNEDDEDDGSDTGDGVQAT